MNVTDESHPQSLLRHGHDRMAGSAVKWVYPQAVPSIRNLIRTREDHFKGSKQAILIARARLPFQYGLDFLCCFVHLVHLGSQGRIVRRAPVGAAPLRRELLCGDESLWA